MNKEKEIFFSIASGEKISCGQYEFIANHAGYASVNGKVEIQPDKSPFVFDVPLQSLDRQIVFSFTIQDDSYQKIIPDIVKLGDRTVQNRDFLRPGKYILVAEKEGYVPIKTEMEIKPSSAPYFIKAIFQIPGK
ncbi:MAG: hypothetical protein HUU50_18590 [Candidatus Brocadiae bacterium]|nr:hypothetical protein [Candidatus Brocadiia bacterium]